MKNVSPSEITNGIKSAKNVSYIPAGAKGIDKLKYGVCRGLRKATNATNEMLAGNDDGGSTIGLAALGFGVLGFAGFDSLMMQEWVLPSGATWAAAAVASLPIVGLMAEKLEKPLRNLEASLLKRMRRQADKTLPIKQELKHAR